MGGSVHINFECVDEVRFLARQNKNVKALLLQLIDAA